MQSEDGELDAEPNAAEQARIDKLTPQQVSEIDSALLLHAAPHWRKVARIVGAAMLQLKGKYVGVPDVYYSKRVANLVDAGALEAQGNLRRMQFSEVRLTSGVN